MWDLDHKESWVPKNWAFELWYLLEKTLESPLDWKEIKRINPKGNQSWIFIGRTDAEADPILWPPDRNSRLLRKDADSGKRLKAEGEGENREWDGWMASPTRWTWVWTCSGSCLDRKAWCTAVHGVTKSQTWLTELNWMHSLISVCAEEKVKFHINLIIKTLLTLLELWNLCFSE